MDDRRAAPPGGRGHGTFVRRATQIALSAAVAVGLLLGDSIPAVLGALSNQASLGSNTMTAGRIFSGTRSSSAWTVSDASSGTATLQSDVLSYAGDARTKTTGAWASTFASTRYFELRFHPTLAPGIAISSATFNLDYRPGAASSSLCFYFDVRVASTSTVLATYGSSGAPVACNATTTLSASATSIPTLTTTDQANDLAIRVYMTNSGTTKTAIIDRATVSGSTAHQSFTLYQKQYTDASTGTGTTTIWPFSTNDTAVYTSAAAWPTAFASGRYLSFTFPAYLPAGATVSSVTMNRVYRTAAAGDTVCWYMDVLNGASPIGTHGSSGTPISCSSSNSTVTSDGVTLAEVNSAALANNTVVKLYNKSSAANKSADTLISLNVTWSMP